MIKPTAPSTLRHILFWSLWFAYEFWGHYDGMPKYTLMEWTYTIYNSVSLVAATYITYGCALRFFRSAPSFIEFWALPPAGKYRLLGNKYLLCIGAVILTYMALSIWLDREFFGWAGTEMVFQFKSRFTKLRDLVVPTVLYSALKVYVMQSNQQLEIANWRIKLYQDTTNYLKLLFEKINFR